LCGVGVVVCDFLGGLWGGVGGGRCVGGRRPPGGGGGGA